MFLLMDNLTQSEQQGKKLQNQTDTDTQSYDIQNINITQNNYDVSRLAALVRTTIKVMSVMSVAIVNTVSAVSMINVARTANPVLLVAAISAQPPPYRDM